jgi:hypothetical protein
MKNLVRAQAQHLEERVERPERTTAGTDAAGHLFDSTDSRAQLYSESGMDRRRRKS